MITAAFVLGPLTVLIGGRIAQLPWHPTTREVLAAATLAGIAATLAADGPVPSVGLPLALLGPAAAVVDAREGRLPDVLTGPLLVATLAVALMPGHDTPLLASTAVIAAAVAMVLATFAGSLIGWGDAKLLPTVAVVVADRGVLLDGLLVISALIAVSAFGVAVVERRTLVPYGPALIVGALAVAATGAG